MILLQRIYTHGRGTWRCPNVKIKTRFRNKFVQNLITPVPSLERFPGPVLWFLAERDENVPLISTRAALERAFAVAPGDDHEIVVIDNALHSFLIPNPNGPPRFAAGFFDHMGEWLAERGYSHAECQQGRDS